MTDLDPTKFRQQFADAVVAGVATPRQLLVIRCNWHEVDLVTPEGTDEPILACPTPDCPVKVLIAMEEGA